MDSIVSIDEQKMQFPISSIQKEIQWLPVQPVSLPHQSFETVPIYSVMENLFGHNHPNLNTRHGITLHQIGICCCNLSGYRLRKTIQQFDRIRIKRIPGFKKLLKISFFTKMHRFGKPLCLHRLRPLVFCNKWSMAVKIEGFSAVGAWILTVKFSFWAASSTCVPSTPI